MSLPKTGMVLVTGAASGIGAALATELAGAGHALALADIQADRLDAFADQLRAAHGVHIEVHHADLSVRAERETLIETVRGSTQPLVGVCNNAGVAAFGRLHELPLADVERVCEVNAVAVHHLTAAFLPDLIAGGEGAILNVASLAANQPLPLIATYAATKAFVLSLSEAVHAEIAGTGVSCTALCPGGVATDIRYSPGAGTAHRYIPGVFWATPESVARAAVDGMRRGRRVVIPGVFERRAMAPAGRFVPRRVALPVMSSAITVVQRLSRRS